MAGESKQLARDQDDVWQEFELALSQIAKSAKSNVDFAEFADELLAQTVELLAAIGGAVWLCEVSGELRSISQTGIDALECPTEVGAHRRLLQRVFGSGEAEIIPPSERSNDPHAPSNLSGLSIVLSPVRVDHRVVALLEVIHGPEVGIAALRGNRRFLSLVAELAADYLRNDEIRRLRRALSSGGQFDDLVLQIHQSLDLKTTAYELANEGRRFIDCDRLSVAIRRGRSYRLTAISGVDSTNRRSQALRRLERLVAKVARTRQAMWLLEGGTEPPPQIEKSLAQYADIANPRSIGILPLQVAMSDKPNAKSAQLGALIVEQFDGVNDKTIQDHASQVARHGASALLNALRYRALPTLPLARWRRGPYATPVLRLRTVLLLVIAIAAAVALLQKYVEFNVRVQGELQPRQQTQVFAPLDSQVTNIAVRHGQRVEKDDLLLQLHSPEVDLEIERIRGEYETTKKRLQAIESTLLQASTSQVENEIEVSQLSSEQEELQHLIKGQQLQLKLLLRQRQELVVRSPQRGQVITWDIEKLLQNRPVQRGQALLSVVELSGPWTAELRVPEAKIGHVLRMADEQSEPPLTSFELATNRGVVYQGKVERIARRTELDLQQRSVVRVTVEVDPNEISNLRPGATIFAQIHCGRKPLGYVLFHDALDEIRGWFLY